MKRSRDENGATGPQLKRHSFSRGDISVPAAQSQQRLTTDDALSYLQAVKDIFKDRKGKYDEFLEVMKDFKAQRINTPGVIARVKELFKGHRDLILGFNTFLPKGYEIRLPPEEEPPKRPPVEFDQAISYVNRIKTRFQREDHIYKAFLEILNMYRKGNKSINEVYQEVATLFNDHQDLLEEFKCFLPDSSGVTHTIARGPAPMMGRRDEKPSTIRHTQVEKPVKREKVLSTSVECDRSSEKVVARERPDRATMEADKEQIKKERELKCEKEQRQVEKEEKDSEQEGDKDSDTQQRLPNKRKSARRADELIRKQSQVGEGGEAMAGTSAPPPSVEEKKIPKGLQRKPAFFEHVKSKLRSRETYQEFLKCLNLYSEEIITRKQLHSLVDGLLGKFPELVEGFNDFLAHCESNEGYLANLVSKKLEDGPLLKPKVERERERERDRDREDGVEHVQVAEKDRERERHLTSREVPSHKGSLGGNREKFATKPISELDLSNCEQCTPSYRLLPKSYPKPLVSHRKPLAHEVLNDSWVSVTSGSEDYSFKHMRRNQYEESLFRCEDDRFELDMLLESTAVTAKRMEELLEKMQDINTKQDGQVHLDDYLTAINIRCIERIYGDHGLDVIELLRKNAAVALPVILSRLKQKRDEWTKCKEDMNKVWAEVYAKNYHKSLDHRSFYFKQQDKKSLSMKALLAEIKEINEKKQKDDDFILSIAAGNRRSLIPDLRFEYPEPDVNEDLYQIIKHSADEMCTTMEQSDKIMRLWMAFFEPIFGVPSRSHAAEDTEEVSKGKQTKLQEAVSRKNEADARKDDKGLVSDMEIERAVSSDKLETMRAEKCSANASSYRIDESVGLAGASDEQKMNNYPCSVSRNDATLGAQSDQMHLAVHPGTDNEKASKEKDNLLDTRRTIDVKRESETWDMRGDHSRIIVNGRMEREEGELSPSPEAEGRLRENFNTRGPSMETMPASGKQDGVRSHGFRGHVEEDDDMECDRKGEGEHDADADDEGEESAPKSSDESENPSEAGEEASGSESGNAEDSREDDEDEQEVKNESEGEAEGMADVEGEGMPLASSEKLLHSCMPLAAHAPSIMSNPASHKGSTVFYGNDTLYVLFRLHQALYERIHAAKVHALAAEEKQKSSKDHSSDLYRKFMRALYNLLDGTIDNAKFEDDCRALIGTQSYVLFTMDKLIFKLVKQLQSIASDEMANKLLTLHTYEKSRAPINFVDAVYHANASTLLQDENVYRFEHRSNPSQLFIQLMEGGAEKLEAAANAIELSFFNYLNRFLFSTTDARRQQAPIFLKRNKGGSADDDHHSKLIKAMHDVFVANGLECKISCKTSKRTCCSAAKGRRKKQLLSYQIVSPTTESLNFTDGLNATIIKRKIGSSKCFPIMHGKISEKDSNL
ncbi:hypothetical protein KP509_31G072300 [Ceratopteris richardii]|uniref:Histone deacetylase interacting domain-containing protein n=1 Tax=Ceratopteris richardii TaxID=49495 RepID=A0A8T2QZE2_CERRI|nr:hypothetical protein KP509_31G072300 [Ceratopteris richardii]